ncbi:MAG: hypothetical protein R2932_23040 [Caldilineaceae bacterium]
MSEIVAHFVKRSAAEIRKEPPGHWGDFELLDVFQHFEEERDDERRGAILELMLRSPEISQTVDYQQLYFELYELLRRHGNFAPCFCVAPRRHCVRVEQHDEGMSQAVYGAISWRPTCAPVSSRYRA